MNAGGHLGSIGIFFFFFFFVFYKEEKRAPATMQTGVKHTCEYRPVDQLIGARSSPHDTRPANQEDRKSNAETDQVLGKLDKRQYVQSIQIQTPKKNARVYRNYD